MAIQIARKRMNVNTKANRLLAIMASAAAEKAVIRVRCGEWKGAEEAADKAIKYMEQAGAYALRRYYRDPQ